MEREESGLFFMSFLEPEKHPVWKSLLLQGHIEPAFARNVGACLGQMHRYTAAQPELAEKFKSDAEFYSLRLEPYLLATAKQHPALARPDGLWCMVTSAPKTFCADRMGRFF